MGPIKEKPAGSLPKYWRAISLPFARPHAGRNYTCGRGHTLASQFADVNKKRDQISMLAIIQISPKITTKLVLGSMPMSKVNIGMAVFSGKPLG
jgi:hypothetical protein